MCVCYVWVSVCCVWVSVCVCVCVLFLYISFFLFHKKNIFNCYKNMYLVWSHQKKYLSASLSFCQFINSTLRVQVPKFETTTHKYRFCKQFMKTQVPGEQVASLWQARRINGSGDLSLGNSLPFTSLSCSGIQSLCVYRGHCLPWTKCCLPLIPQARSSSKPSFRLSFLKAYKDVNL